MRFKHKLILIILIAVMATGIIYIGIKENEKRQAEINQTVSDDTTNLYLWYSDDNMTDFFMNAAVAFHEKNKDIRVIPVLIDNIEYLESINEASLGGDDFPDVFLLSNDSLEKAYLAGLASEARDADNVLNSEHFPTAALSAATYHDKLIGYPLFFETSVLMYNKSYLADWADRVNAGDVSGDDGEFGGEIDFEDDGDYGEEIDESEEITVVTGMEDTEGVASFENYIPSTIENILNFGEVYEAPERVEGIFKWDVTDIFYNYLFVGGYLNVGGKNGDRIDEIDTYNENAITCMEVYQNLNQYFSIDAETSEYDKVLEEFLDGKMVYTIVTSDAIQKAEQSVKERMAAQLEDIANGSETITDVYEFGYSVVPEISDELESKSLSVTNVLAINGYSLKKEAANKFAAFLTTDYADHLYERTGKIASSTDVASANEAVAVFKSEYENSVPLAKIVETSNLWVQLEITFTEIWLGADVSEMMRQFSDQLNSQLGK